MSPARNDIEIGFMQGRLSPLIDGRIQAFPQEHWHEEFAAGAELGFGFLEWTLDQAGLYDNPLMSREGRGEMRQMRRRSGLTVPTATLDCVMQAPFYKATGNTHDNLLNDLATIVDACGAANIETMVVPLVDNGAITSAGESEALHAGLEAIQPLLERTSVRIAFESDQAPEELAGFIDGLPAPIYGLTYDIGNSAAAGFDPDAEFAAYGHRVTHVHVKDRLPGGTTVPLGTGNADFDAVFQNLFDLGYSGRYVLQTARAKDDDHAAVLADYRAQTLDWIANAGRSTDDAMAEGKR
jgi:hexulose-6-phosphate isomerase